jgi:putative membrane protein
LAPDGDTADATRRTRLAGERTQLAWWRTGLTALAVGVGIGRVVPELDDGITEWPYVSLGTAFALYGLLLIVYGSQRGRTVDSAVATGGFRPFGKLSSSSLAAAGVLLALATCALILTG